MNAAKACCICFSKKAKRLRLYKKFPEVKKAMDPELILWENLGYTTLSRIVRITISTIIALALVILCTLINLYGTTADAAI
jgi:hypothetical protein